MMKKKLLARSVVLGLLCASVLPLSCAYADDLITVNGDATFVYEGYSFAGNSYSDVDNNGSVDLLRVPVYSASNPSNRAIYFTGSADNKLLRFVYSGASTEPGLAFDYNTGGGVSIGIENNSSLGSKTVIDADHCIVIHNSVYNGFTSADGIQKQFGLLNNSGDLEIKNGISIGIGSGATDKIGILNKAGNKLVIGKSVEVSSNNATGIGIENNGTMEVNGDSFRVSDAIKNFTNHGKAIINVNNMAIIRLYGSPVDGVGIDNTDELDIHSNSMYISGMVNGISNHGKLSINSGDLIVYGDDAAQVALDNSGMAEINSRRIQMNNIKNSTGKLLISANEAILRNITNEGDLLKLDVDNTSATEGSFIQGEIKHSPTGETFISLSSNSEVGTVFTGTVKDSNEKFHLNLGRNSLWEATNQVEEVEGVCMNDSFIQLNSDRYVYNENNHPVYSWGSGYSTLRLKNFQATSGTFNVTTDLMNNAGDKIVFNGYTPSDARLGVMIWNNGNSGGTEHPNDGIHKVTIIDAPGSTNMNFTCWLGFYDNFNEYLLYKPIVEEEMTGDRKLWNFVGWERSGNKTPKKESDQQIDGFDLNATELDNTLKRLNDIRTDPSEVGVWLRGESGKMNIRSYGYDYNLMSGGYDWDYDSNAAKMFLGLGISYAKNDCDTGIIGNTKSMGYNLYGSWLSKENKDYVDVIVKYGTLDKDYAGLDDNNIFVKGDYDKNLFSIAAKYGRRIEREDGWYWEPSVGLTWGRISSADYTDSQGIKIHADSSTSKMASLGVQVGKNIKGTEYYGKFEVRHDFDGKMHVSVPDSNLPGSSVYDDMGGTWYKVGIGAARKINKNNSFYIDIEKDFGNKVKKPYSIGFGYRYTW